MMQKWMPHLKWSDRRPPLLIFESYALLQKGVPYPLPAVAAPVADDAAPAAQLQTPAPDQAAAPEPSAAAPATQAAEVTAEPEQAAKPAPEGVPAAVAPTAA